MPKRKQTDPIPEEFASYDGASEFWDTHNTTDYPEAFQKVESVTAFRGRYYEIEVEADVVKALRAQAQHKGVTVSRLASDLLRQQLAASQ